MCEFCTELRWQRAEPARTVWQSEEWALIPTKGCFIRGYCLLLPIEHELSLGTLAAEDLQTAAVTLDWIRSIIERRFGPTIVAEHGATVCDAGAACCDHAHLHIVPAGDTSEVERAYRRVGGEPLVLSGVEELARFRGAAYVYLSPGAKRHLVWAARNFPRQFVRRVTSRVVGKGEYYDWRVHSFEEEMWATKSILQPLLKGESCGAHFEPVSSRI